MQPPPITKYQPFPPIHLPDRQWPSRTITKAPIWCSVDLRDGNQALPIPMGIEEKLELFQTLVRVGFKEIEVGFPSASQTEFDFLRCLIEGDLIPDDVIPQVLVQSREELIHRTFESLQGCKRAIVHLYNSTSPAQRRVVFRLEKPDIIGIATRGASLIRRLADQMPGSQIRMEYSPESFSTTEVEFSLEICEAVMEIWGPTPEDPIILNLPNTVEMMMPNVHADQIEWMSRHLRQRDRVILSLHTHNDRGTGIAATEMGLLAGADRVEGTLFGNGERTGNLDIVVVALNMYTQGVHPGLDLSDLNSLRDVYERCTRLEVPIRQPYGGDLVFTAFSGSHQDAINKGMKARDPSPGASWDVPYLPIDPRDIGRTYDAIIRINSQSGKGGVAYVMESRFGFQLPRAMHPEFGKLINDLSDARGHELTPEDILHVFQRDYLAAASPVELVSFDARATAGDAHRIHCCATLRINDEERQIAAQGNGPIDAFVHALKEADICDLEVLSYSEHSLSGGAEAQAVSYIQIRTRWLPSCFGAAIDTNIDFASIKAVISAVNRSLKQKANAAG